MRSRDAVLAAVRGRLNRAITGQDLSGLLTEEARKDAGEARSLHRDPSDLDASYALGIFHWLRYLAVPDGADQHDLAAATRILAPVFRANPDAVPEPLRSQYQQAQSDHGETSADVAAATSRAGELLEGRQRTQESCPSPRRSASCALPSLPRPLVTCTVPGVWTYSTGPCRI